MKYCANCGKKITRKALYCSFCGTKVASIDNTKEQNIPASSVSEGNSSKITNSITKKVSRKKFPTIKVAVILLPIIIICIVFSYIFFWKNNNSQKYTGEKYLTFTENGMIKLYLENGKTVDIIRSNDSKIKQVYYTKSGKTFYPRQCSGGSFKLYCKDVNENDAEEIKIAEKVKEYAVSDNGKTIVYLTIDNDLFKHVEGDNEDKKIAYDVSDFSLFSNGNTVYVQTKSGKHYMINSDNTKAKLSSSEVFDIFYISNNSESVLYLTGDNHLKKDIYIKTSGKDAEILVDEVSGVNAVYEDGTFHYTKHGSLFYYNGNTSEKVSDTYIQSLATSKSNKQIVYRDEDNSIFIAQKGKCKKTNIDAEYSFLGFSQNGKTLYIMDPIDREKSLFSGDIYTVAISGFTIDAPKLYKENTNFICLTLNGGIIYSTENNTKSTMVDVYINNQLVKECVNKKIQIDMSENGESIIFNFDRELYIYQKDKVSFLSENVNDFGYLNNDTLYYVVANKYETNGNLYIYNGNSKQIAGEAEITNNIEPKNHIIRATSTN